MEINERNVQAIKYMTYSVIGVLVIISIFLVGALIEAKYTPVDQEFISLFTIIGPLGDSINGLLAPIIGILAVATTFLAFLVQFDANQQLRRDADRDRFETKFYELLRLHRQNIEEMALIFKCQGRDVFRIMYDDYRFIYYHMLQMKKAHAENLNIKFKFPKRDYMEMVYLIFFMGIDKVLKSHSFKGKKEQFLKDIVKSLRSMVNDKVIRQIDISVYVPKPEIVGQVDVWEHDKLPFHGYSSELGHYFRHIYQMIKGIVLHKPFDPNPKKDRDIKYGYIKMVRAQLSNHEQTMIYFNSFFAAGSVWWGDENISSKNKDGSPISYFLDWGIIKNIPFSYTDFVDVEPLHEFRRLLLKRGQKKNEVEKRLKKLFEWYGG